MQRHQSTSRSRSVLTRACTQSVLITSACFLWLVTPVAAQVVDNGTFVDSLECADVFVDGVDANDSLNVREGPGVQFTIVLTLEPAAPAVATGLTSPVGSGTWYQIGIGSCEPVGWVNSSFLGTEGTESTEGAVGDPVPTTATDAVGGGESDGEQVGADQSQPLGDSPTTEDLGEVSESSGSDLELSPLATALLVLGLLGLITGVTMFVRGRHTAIDEGPPPGMVGPPGGPYFLARVDSRTAAPRTITIGRAPEPTPTRRSNDPAVRADEGPESAFPHIPDLSSEVPENADEITSPAVRLFGPSSFGAINGAEDEIGS